MSEKNSNSNVTGLGSGDGGGSDSALSRVTGKLNRSTLLMGLMFAVGIGWVVWESQQIAKPVDDDEKFKTEIMVNNGIKEMVRQVDGETGQADRTTEVVQASYYEPHQRQVASSKLRQNPFGVKKEIEQVATTIDVEPEAEPEPIKPIAPPVDALKLQSVVLSSPPSAMISGVIVTEGRVINGWKVSKIERRRVMLRWQDETHILKMVDE